MTVKVVDYNGSQCSFMLYDPETGDKLDFGTATRDKDTLVMNTGTARTAYLYPDDCRVRISAS